MQCRNYMQQYSRTKSIREINKSRNSYKHLLEQPKTRDNSNPHLKLSDNKKSSQQIDKNACNQQNLNNYMANESIMGSKNQVCPLSTSLNNIHNITNISYGKLNSQMKLRVTEGKPDKDKNDKRDRVDKSIRSISSQEQLCKYNNQNSQVIGSMSNMGVGLGSHKKKPKLVTLAASNSGHAHSMKKSKNLNETLSISRNQKSRSISKSHHNSAINSKYSTNAAHEAAYRSVKKQQGNKNNVEIVTLNTSMLFIKDEQTQNTTLADIYNRVKSVLDCSKRKEKEWELEKIYYQNRIKQLQKQLQNANRKNIIGKQGKFSYPNIHNQSTFSTANDGIQQKHSNRNGYYNHR